MKKLTVIGWIGSFLIAVALIGLGTTVWFDFNLVEWMTFGISWLAKGVFTIVAILGLIALGELLYNTFKK